VNRWLALAVAIVAGAAAAFAAAIAFVSVVYGALWIYVFGDNSWPAWVDPVAGGLMLAFAFGTWVVVAWRVWRSLARTT